MPRRPPASPSAHILASLALLAPQPALGAPVLSFLYPQPPAPNSSSSSRRRSTRSRSKQRRLPAEEVPTAEKLALRLVPDNTGEFRSSCWALQGQSNCARQDNAHNDTAPATTTVEDEALEGATKGVAAVGATTGSNVTTTTSTATPTTTTAAVTSTVKPYTMAFSITNIPPGWQKPPRTHFYSKNLVIGFSVSLTFLIIATIVGCVIWRVKVARTRRDSEKALSRKKAQIARGLHNLHSENDTDDDDQRQSLEESTRQRGLRRRRRNTRAVSETGDAHDVSKKTTSSSGATPRTREWAQRWKRRRARWRMEAVNKSVDPREKEQEDRMVADTVPAPDSENGSSPTTRDESAMTTTTTQIPSADHPANTHPDSAAQATEPSTGAVASHPFSSPPSSPPPPASPSPLPSAPPPAATAPTEGEPEPEVEISPPAYRRRNFRAVFGRGPATAPAETSARREDVRLGKQCEAEGNGMPEEYMYLAGVPPEVRRETEGDVRPVPEVVVEMETEEEDADEEPELVPREAVSGHIATDDKSTLARLQAIGSEPPQAHALLTSHAPPTSESAPTWQDEDDELEYEDLDPDNKPSGSGSSPPAQELFPALPPITSAHLFVPSGGESLPAYAGGSTSFPVEKPVAPPPDEDEDAAMSVSVLVPSAPPPEDGRVVSASAPALEEDGEVGVPTYEP